MLHLYGRPPSAIPHLANRPPVSRFPPPTPTRLLPRAVTGVWCRAVSNGGRSGSSGSGGNDGADGGGGWNGGNSGDGGEERRWSPFSWYVVALDKHPVLTKSITSGFLNLIGDLICQLVVDQVAKVDVKRACLFGFLGFALVGPTLHYWYLYLSKVVTIEGVSAAGVRLLLDQFIFAPIFIGVFMAALVTLEGKPSLVVPKLRQELGSAVVANWQLWIPFQFLNFHFVPQKFQVLAGNFVALLWNVILSFKSHNEVVQK